MFVWFIFNVVVVLCFLLRQHVVIATQVVQAVVVDAGLFHEPAILQRRGGVECRFDGAHDFMIDGHGEILCWIATKIRYQVE